MSKILTAMLTLPNVGTQRKEQFIIDDNSVYTEKEQVFNYVLKNNERGWRTYWIEGIDMDTQGEVMDITI